MIRRGPVPWAVDRAARAQTRATST
jgi:hypothetical protein